MRRNYDKAWNICNYIIDYENMKIKFISKKKINNKNFHQISISLQHNYFTIIKIFRLYNRKLKYLNY